MHTLIFHKLFSIKNDADKCDIIEDLDDLIFMDYWFPIDQLYYELVMFSLNAHQIELELQARGIYEGP